MAVMRRRSTSGWTTWHTHQGTSQAIQHGLLGVLPGVPPGVPHGDTPVHDERSGPMCRYVPVINEERGTDGQRGVLFPLRITEILPEREAERHLIPGLEVPFHKESWNLLPSSLLLSDTPQGPGLPLTEGRPLPRQARNPL